MNTKITNYHVLQVSYKGPSNSRGSKVQIKSERFEQSILISYNSSLSDSCEIAEVWLKDNGFKVVGHADGKDKYYIISSTFKPLK
jgi:hypothetical protein